MRYREIFEDIPNTSGAFARWFGNSKVVDSEGRPLVCYHGTFQDFHVFKPGSHFGDSTAANIRLHNLENDPGEKHKRFGGHGGSVVPVYLRIKNPLRIEDDGTLNDADDIADAALAAGGITQEDHDYICDMTHDAPKTRLLAVLEDHGYDGLVYRNTVEGNADSWVPFKPEQIKSVFNNGAFNPKKRSISEDIDFEPGEAEANFKHWFGASKVVDEAGNPLKCYHGTFAHFDSFYPMSHFGDQDAAHARINNSMVGRSGGATRKTYDGANIIPVYLSIKCPLRIEDDGSLSDIYDIESAVLETGVISEDDIKDTGLFRTLAQAGFDGLVYQNTVEGNADSWVPFWKHQIKSVFNRGTWSRLRDNISEDE